MKQYIFLVLIVLDIFCLPVYPNSKYFWAGDQKINIVLDYSTMVIVFKQEQYYKNNTFAYKNIPALAEVIISEDQKITVLKFQKIQSKSEAEILMHIGIDINELEWYSFGYIANEEISLRPTNRISFKLKAGINEDKLIDKMERRAVFAYTHYGTKQIEVKGADIDIISLSNEIYESGIAEYCYPDFIANIVHNDDPLYPDQYFLNNTKKLGIGGTVDADIDAPEAWEITKGSSSIKVAVIDNGVESHDDLKDESGNSRIIGGYTPHTGGNGAPSNSYDYHGEACSGIIAASHNDINVRGVAPKVKIVRVNIFEPNTSNDEIGDGIRWSADNGADVLSNSWGYTQSGFTWPNITNAINYARSNGRSGKGCIVVFAAGNTGSFIQFPATVTGVLCVSALSKYGSITGYSSRGSRIDISAIGGDQDIRTLDRMGGNGRNSGNDMSNFDGTSAACPQVSGVAALILSMNSNLTEQQVKDLITQNATDIGAAGKDDLYGWGRLDAAKTLAKLKVQLNTDFTYTEGNASITRTNEGVPIQFLTSPRIDVAAGYYICDRYIVQSTSSGYAEAPLGWFLNSEGYSSANTNYATGWVNKSITSNSIALQTYFYYIKYDILGQAINKWAPYDPSGKYIVLGKPLVAPLIANITQNPVPIYKGTSGYVYCNLSQGNGTLRYNWISTNQPNYISLDTSGNSCQITYLNVVESVPGDGPTWDFGCTVSNPSVSGWSDTKYFTPSLNSLLYGCPTLAFDNRGTLTNENPLLITSMSNPGKDVTDHYLINEPLTANNNKINLTIHEPQTEHTWFDNVSLLETQANPGERIVVNDEGQVINYKDVLPVRILLNSETDITENLLYSDSLLVNLNPGDILTITRNATEGDGDVVIIGEEPPVGQKRIPAMMMNVVTEKQSDVIEEEVIIEKFPIGNFFLRPHKSTISKRLRNLPAGTIEITVNKKLTLDYFVFVSDLRTSKTKTLPLLSATHSKNGNIRNKLIDIDQNYAEMYPTERIDLSFGTNTTTGNRAYILKTVGRYETDTTFIGKQNNLAKINEQPIVPTENKLYDNYPNPFNPSTIIKYSLKDEGRVTVKIFNTLGEEIRTLVDEIKPSGNYNLEFNANNLPSGVYIYRLQSGEFVSSKKMLLIK